MFGESLNELKNVIIDFYRVTGILTVVYDEYCNIIYSYPETQARFCAEIRRSERLDQKCLECDRRAFDYCRREKKSYIYECHMGLIEAVSPIIEFDRVIGFLMMGQALPEGCEARVRERIDELSDKLECDKNILREALLSMNCYSSETLRSAAKIMDMCTCYISSKHLSLSSQSTLIYEIDRYAHENLGDCELSTQLICRRFLISRSTLYKLSKETFGVGISDRIHELRIEKAKKLLAQKKLPIGEIGRLCGFSEPNYFSRAFKKSTGVLPKDFCEK